MLRKKKKKSLLSDSITYNLSLCLIVSLTFYLINGSFIFIYGLNFASFHVQYDIFFIKSFYFITQYIFFYTLFICFRYIDTIFSIWCQKKALKMLSYVLLGSRDRKYILEIKTKYSLICDSPVRLSNMQIRQFWYTVYMIIFLPIILFYKPLFSV